MHSCDTAYERLLLKSVVTIGQKYIQVKGGYLTVFEVVSLEFTFQAFLLAIIP